MTEAEKKVESSAPEARANSSESWWDKFTGKNATEAAKKKMEDILTLQKTELANVISEFKQGKTDIVGKSNQQKMELLAEVSKTINNLKNNRNINGIVNDNLSVTEDAYEKLEAKITGTKEVVDFKHPEFIEMAIANLEQFKKDLTDASVTTSEAKPVEISEAKPVEISETPVATVSEVTPEAEVVVASTKDFYEHINFSKKKKDWPAKERELAIESIKKEVNSNNELADALSKLEYSSKWIKSGKKSSVHSVKDVLLVQLALTNLGYKPSILDGVYKDSKLGSETWVMVISFQRGLNAEAGKEVLKEDGQIGPKTLEKMIEALRGKDISAPIEKDEEKTSIPQVEEKPTPTPQDTTGNISKTEGKMETIVIQEENPRKILTIGEIDALSRTENQGKQQFEQELQKRNIKVTRDTSNSEYVGDSRIRWENSPYNPKSKTAEEYRFIALNNLFTAGGESTKEALNYMSEHPEDPAVVRLNEIIDKVNTSMESENTESTETSPTDDTIEPIVVAPETEVEAPAPETPTPVNTLVPSKEKPIEISSISGFKVWETITVKENDTYSSFKAKITDFIKVGNQIRVIVEKKDQTSWEKKLSEIEKIK